MSPIQRGKLLVISGPSGAGKTSICDQLLQTVPNAQWSVSATTRARRGEEVDGRDYQFVSPAQFQKMVEDDAFLETAQYLGHWYGTPRKPVEDALAEGRVIILEIDVQGAAQVARRLPESVRVFVLPPTMETLKARLAGRDTESDDLQRRRLDKADGEIRFARDSGVFPYFITNDTIQDSVRLVLKLLSEPPAGGVGDNPQVSGVRTQ